MPSPTSPLHLSTKGTEILPKREASTETFHRATRRTGIDEDCLGFNLWGSTTPGDQGLKLGLVHSIIDVCQVGALRPWTSITLFLCLHHFPEDLYWLGFRCQSPAFCTAPHNKVRLQALKPLADASGFGECGIFKPEISHWQYNKEPLHSHTNTNLHS